MESSLPWESNSRSAGQRIPCILWNSKIHNCGQNRVSPVTVPSQMDPTHIDKHIYFKMNLLFSHTHLGFQVQVSRLKFCYICYLTFTRSCDLSDIITIIILVKCTDCGARPYAAFSSRCCLFPLRWLYLLSALLSQTTSSFEWSKAVGITINMYWKLLDEFVVHICF
jgi:hypothetical protein